MIVKDIAGQPCKSWTVPVRYIYVLSILRMCEFEWGELSDRTDIITLTLYIDMPSYEDALAFLQKAHSTEGTSIYETLTKTLAKVLDSRSQIKRFRRRLISRGPLCIVCHRSSKKSLDRQWTCWRLRCL